MRSLLQTEESEISEQPQASLGQQVLWMLLHSALALGIWIALMLVGYAVNPTGVPQWVILLFSAAVPLVAGVVVARVRADEVAGMVWLTGAIWLMIFSLHLLDLPTGPGRCMDCSATEKLARSFLSLPRPSGLMDDDAPFLATWPAAALIGYSIGGWLGTRRVASRGQFPTLNQ